jgi:hypothetical protein
MSAGSKMPACRQPRSSVSPPIFGSPRSRTTASYRSVCVGKIGPLAIAGAVNGVPSFGKCSRQLTGKAYFVLDDKNPQLDIL